MVPGATFNKSDSPSNASEASFMAKVPYQEVIGSLMYAAIATHPDIAFAVLYLSQFLKNPGCAHWDATKQIFWYLTGTKHLSLTYGRESHDLMGYMDADGMSQSHCKAISGYALLIDGRSVSWRSHKQELITLSTTEAEYVATTHVAKEAVWLCNLL